MKLTVIHKHFLAKFPILCEESIKFFEDHALIEEWSVSKFLEYLKTSDKLSERERTIYIRNFNRFIRDPQAIRLGGDAVETEHFHVKAAGVLVKEGTQEECQSYIDNMSWVKFFKRAKQGFVKSTINDFTVAETDMGQTYKTRRSVKEVEITLERKITDSVEDLSFWEAVDY